METILTVLPIILYVLLSILVVALIILIFKAMKTLEKVDQTLDDVNNKMGKLNGVFNLVDRSADVLNIFTNKVVTTLTTSVINLFKKQKEKKEEIVDE